MWISSAFRGINPKYALWMEMEMPEKVKIFKDVEKIFSPGETVVVGVSGGADSVCLLKVLSELAGEYALKPVVVHINHGIRGDEAARDELFVKELCDRLGVECRVYHEDIPGRAAEMGMTEEEAGRQVRYQRFAQVCKEYGSTKLAVAHNADDQSETILFNLIRGSSVAGLCGMKPVSHLSDEEDIFIVRPLLGITRREIEDYLNKEQQEWITDSTNKEQEYTRNYIRQVIIPDMKKISPRVGEHLRRLGHEMCDVRQLVESQADVMYERACSDNSLNVSVIEDAPEIIKRELVYRFICENAGRKKDIASVHVSSVLELMKNAAGKSVDLPYDIIVYRDYDRLVAVRRGADRIKPRNRQSIHENLGEPELPVTKEQCGKEFQIPGPGEILKMHLGEGRTLVVRCFDYDKSATVPEEKSKVWFDADKIGQKLVLRTPRQGDYFCAYPDGRTKKLNRYFIEAKVSRQEREHVPVVAMGSRCLIITGYRHDEALRVEENSKRVLEMELKLD